MGKLRFDKIKKVCYTKLGMDGAPPPEVPKIIHVEVSVSSGIYVIENKETKQQYYGQGLDVEKRMWHDHRNCDYIYSTIKKYGEEMFTRKVFIYCEEWELDRLEIACIKIFHSHVSEGGYNISWGGSAPMKERHHTSVTKAIQSEKNKGLLKK